MSSSSALSDLLARTALPPLAVHLVAVLALWQPLVRVLGWAVSLVLAVGWLSLVDSLLHQAALRSAKEQQWEQARYARAACAQQQ